MIEYYSDELELLVMVEFNANSARIVVDDLEDVLDQVTVESFLAKYEFYKLK